MRKWSIIGIICLSLIASYYWRHNANPQKPPQTVTVKRGNIVEKATAVGSIVPNHSITVKSQLNGIVEKVFRDAGGYVKKDENLVEIKPNPTPTEYAGAIEKVTQDKANVAADKKNVDNFNYLLKHSVIRDNYDAYLKAKQSLAVDSATLQFDEQKLAMITMGKTTIGGVTLESVIKSPIDGYILQRNVDVGDPVISMGSNQSATVLFTIANMHDLLFKGTVDEIDSGKIHIDMPAEITIGALSGKKLQGKLTKLALQSDKQNTIDNQKNGLSGGDASSNNNSPFNVGFQVEIADIQIPKDVKLRSGYSATASIIIKKVNDVLMIPERVLVFKDKKIFVNLPTDKGEKPKKQEIKIGISDGINAEVLSGLKEGQKVLVLESVNNS